jgi:hypothetical protein
MRLNQSVLAIVLSLGAIAPGTHAGESRVVTGLYYFPSDDEKIAERETEFADEHLGFRYSRNPRHVARELASEELSQGNICLKQLDMDIQSGLDDGEIQKLCRVIFRTELAKKLRGPAPACAMNVEARETKDTIELALVFQLVRSAPTDLRQSRTVASIGGDDFSPKVPEMAPRKGAPIGKPASTWKELLKNGSCSLNEDQLEEYLERFARQEREREQLARCNLKIKKQTIKLARIQTQFHKYVPDEWLRALKGKDIQILMSDLPNSVDYTNLRECRDASAQAARQFRDLREVASALAEKHNVAALEAGFSEPYRGLSSE